VDPPSFTRENKPTMKVTDVLKRQRQSYENNIKMMAVEAVRVILVTNVTYIE
jgi:hypothetical protein